MQCSYAVDDTVNGGHSECMDNVNMDTGDAVAVNADAGMQWTQWAMHSECIYAVDAVGDPHTICRMQWTQWVGTVDA